MAIRRQGYLFDFQDVGNLPIIRIDQLSEREQSVLVGEDIQDGFGVLDTVRVGVGWVTCITSQILVRY